MYVTPATYLHTHTCIHTCMGSVTSSTQATKEEGWGLSGGLCFPQETCRP